MLSPREDMVIPCMNGSCAFQDVQYHVFVLSVQLRRSLEYKHGNEPFELDNNPYDHGECHQLMAHLG